MRSILGQNNPSSELGSDLMQLELSVIIPTLNESESIARVIYATSAELGKIVKSGEIIVVDDSTDNTTSVLLGLTQTIEMLQVFHRIAATGVGSAIRLGLEKAVGKYAIVIMGDMPEDIKYLRPILQTLKDGYQVVSASRFLPGCKFAGYPIRKRIANLLCNLVIKMVFSRPDLNDFTTLLKGYDSGAIRKLGLEANGFDLGAEIEMKAIRRGLHIAEIPADQLKRRVGFSKLALSRQAHFYVKRIAKVWLFYR